MDKITREKNLISTDVFSTYRDGGPIGTQEFLLMDTETWEYTGIKSDILNKEWENREIENSYEKDLSWIDTHTHLHVKRFDRERV